MISLGLDLSLAKTGWCVVGDTNPQYPSCGLIQTDKKVFLGEGELIRRISTIASKIDELIVGYSPDVIVVESAAMRAQGRIVDLAQLSGVVNHVVFYGASEYGRKKAAFYSCPPKSVKAFAGNGNADKEQMVQFAYDNYSLTFVDDNVCDAFYLGLVGLCISDKQFNQKVWTAKQSKVKDSVLKLRGLSVFNPRSK